MRAIASTSGGDIVKRLLFLQTHRETDRFFSASGVQLVQTNRDQFHFHRSVFCSQIKARVSLTLTKTVVLRIMLNIDGVPITSKSHTNPSHSKTSQLRSRVGLTLGKDETLRVTFILDVLPITSKSPTHPSHPETSRLLTSSLSLGVPVPRSTQFV